MELKLDEGLQVSSKYPLRWITESEMALSRTHEEEEQVDSAEEAGKVGKAA